RGTGMVAQQPIHMERPGIPTTEVGGRCVHGCIPGCMGDCVRGSGDLEIMDTRGAPPPHQLQGTEGGLVPYTDASHARQNHPSYMRQHDSDRANQQIRWHQISTAAGSGDNNLGFLHQDRNATHDNVRTITIQSRRLAFETNDSPAGVVDQQLLLSTSRLNLGSTLSRPLRNSGEREGSPVCVLATRGIGMETGRIQLLLEGPRSGVYLPTLVPPQQSPGEDQDRQGAGDSDHPTVASHDLVPNDPDNVSQRPNPSPESDGRASAREQPPASGTQPDVVINSMERRRQQAV
ncbi:hypothetical protein BGZ82_004529, partial [Podila clonocystis]